MIAAMTVAPQRHVARLCRSRALGQPGIDFGAQPGGSMTTNRVMKAETKSSVKIIRRRVTARPEA